MSRFQQIYNLVVQGKKDKQSRQIIRDFKRRFNRLANMENKNSLSSKEGFNDPIFSFLIQLFFFYLKSNGELRSGWYAVTTDPKVSISELVRKE